MGRPASRDEVLEGLGEAVAVHDLAVGDEAGRQLEAHAADDATALDLGGGKVATVDVETDGATGGVLTEGERHGRTQRGIGRPLDTLNAEPEMSREAGRPPGGVSG